MKMPRPEPVGPSLDWAKNESNGVTPDFNTLVDRHMTRVDFTRYGGRGPSVEWCEEEVAPSQVHVAEDLAVG